MFDPILTLQTNTGLPLAVLILFNVLKTVDYCIMFYCVSKYFFFERMWSGKAAKIYYSICIALVLFVGLIHEEIVELLIVVLLTVGLIAGKKKFKWTAIIQLIPWLGLTTGFLVPIIDAPAMLIPSVYSQTLYKGIAYGVLFLSYFIQAIVLRKWRHQFNEEVSTHKLAKWEKIMLYVVGLILLIFVSLLSLEKNEAIATLIGVSDVGMLKTLSISIITDQTALMFYIISFAVATFLLDLISVTTVLVANRQTFYHRKVLDMQFNIIAMMAEIVENRDENTGGHIQRTAKYVNIIANELKNEGQFKKILTDRYIEDMQVAAPLHDIGKIHVSDLILNKPGRLTDEEFEIMKSHAPEGEKLLNRAREYLGDFSYLDIAVDMAGSHHEWVNGKGYPDHKKGEEIPLCARIMAVADVFDALTSKRCYRDAMAVNEAYKIIRKERGTHFDMVVVDAFFAAQEQIEAALNEFMAD